MLYVKDKISRCWHKRLSIKYTANLKAYERMLFSNGEFITYKPILHLF